MSVVAITLNGDASEVEEGSTLVELLAGLRVQPERVVVEHNNRVLRAPDLEGVRLRAGDEVEIVQFVGGG
jgi:sulfur carrier protein